MTKQLLLTALLIGSFIRPAFAQQGGTDSYIFLELPNSARVGALGGNQVGLVDNDLNLWFHNPATLAAATPKQLLINYVPYVSDINYGFVGYSQQLSGIGNIAVGIQNINYGSFTMTDEFDQTQGTFKATEYALMLGYAKQLSPNFSLGITFKPIFSHFENYRSFALAADLGGTYLTNDGLFSAGAVLKNVGSQVTTYNGTNEPLPLDLQMGFSKKLQHAPFRFLFTFQGLLNWDMEYTPDDSQNGSAYSSDKDWDVSFGDNLLRHTVVGVEFLPSKTFFINLGYNHRRRQELKLADKASTVGYSWGFGFKVYKFRFAYGSARYHLGGSSNHFSLTANLSEFGL